MKMTTMVTRDQALPGKSTPIATAEKHLVLGTPMHPPFPEHLKRLIVGMGCFWGAERLFWQLKGVYSTAVGYAGGFTTHPSYQEVCSGLTAHAEVVQIIYDPSVISINTLLGTFWEEHDPTQGMRQGNDMGTQYRSVIYVDNDDDLQAAIASRENYQAKLSEMNLPAITTEINIQKDFYYAEDYHQQYLAKVPNGYCGLRGLGIQY